MNKLTKYLLPTLYFGVISVMIVCVLFVVSGVKSYLVEKPKYDYALEDMFYSDVMSVVKTENDLIIKPFVSDNVSVARSYYNYKDDKDKQTKSIIFFKNTYLQNSGVDYVSDEDFDVISVLSGEIVSIEDNEIYGKVMRIKYNDNLEVVYSNIKDVILTVGYNVSQGEIIASSNKSSIDNDDKSYLHFEVHYKGETIDPESLYTLSVSEIE